SDDAARTRKLCHTAVLQSGETCGGADPKAAIARGCEREDLGRWQSVATRWPPRKEAVAVEAKESFRATDPKITISCLHDTRWSSREEPLLDLPRSMAVLRDTPARIQCKRSSGAHEHEESGDAAQQTCTDAGHSVRPGAAHAG